MEPFHSCSRATFHHRKSPVVGKLTLRLHEIESPMTHLLAEPNFEAFTIENRKKVGLKLGSLRSGVQLSTTPALQEVFVNRFIH